ncbi:AI-2E family transporter [Chelativorans sp. M5D2P16]|uniref:AI-2E family transporter n=1 Tax=Chelativorans sp. M5D2P16 TaxID=3095678 RepID=UPI002ACAA87A|nr:AI-2E family transporter [Chelativorans sp. M5D2P16]MDZ5696709.1 AI-2E family transporter [Chelativorans sp. M5D2P16]
MAETTAKRSMPTVAASARTSLVVGGVIVGALIVWQLSNVLLLFFGAVVAAVILRSGAKVLEDHTPVTAPWSLVLSIVVIAALMAAFFFLLGTQIATEASSLVQRLPEMITRLGERFGVDDLYERLAERVSQFAGGGSMASEVAGYTSVLVSAVTNLVLVLVAGIYLAARPRRYRQGILRLIPPGLRDNASDTFDNTGRALRLWLLGQLVSMAIVGALTTLGLYLIGMPSALALGFLAGLSEFVPIVGPILSAVPAILLALSEGGNTVFWVIGLYFAVQQIESNVIMPLVQRRTVDLPPVLTLFALLALGVLFGPLGVLLATPLTVVLYVAVNQLYLRDTLQEDVEIPGLD